MVSGANAIPTAPLTASIANRITESVRNPASCTTGSSRIQPPSAMRTTPNMKPCAVLRRSVGKSSPLQSWNSDCCPMPAPAPNSTTLIRAVTNETSKKMNGTNAASCRIVLHASIERRLTRSISGMYTHATASAVATNQIACSARFARSVVEPTASRMYGKNSP